MARVRQIYQGDLLYVGPTGYNSATGKHFESSTWGLRTGLGNNLVAQLYRVQRADYNWAKRLTDVNQFGELAAIDRIPLEQPTVGLTFSYLLSNLVNEKLIGFDVSKAGDASEVSCISGILASLTDTKNYFIKTVSEGADAVDNNASSYNSISLGNGFVTSYSSQGSVGGFPTVDVGIEALNIQGDSHAGTLLGTGQIIPAVNPTDGTAITGYVYNLPTGLTSYLNTALTANQGLSVLRPGDITLNLSSQITAGDGFFDSTDLKVQSYNFSFNLNREDLQKLGSKYAFAKTIQFPVTASLQVTAIVGDFQTGNLIRIVEDNKTFNPSVTITKPGDTSTVIAKYTLKGAKMDNNDVSSSIGANKSVSMTFNAQLGGPQDLNNGVFMSGVTA